jgi:hypothetical protein
VRNVLKIKSNQCNVRVCFDFANPNEKGREDKMFWNRKQTKEGGVKLPGPKEIPEPVGRYMVVQEKKDPDWVWKLKGVVRPAGKNKTFYCRVFIESQVAQSGVKVKDWTSLDERPELILWEGYFDKETNRAWPEKFVKPSNSSG